MQGNCTETPNGAPLEPPRTSETQCVITVKSNFLLAADHIWIHDLYIEAKHSRESDGASGTPSVTPDTTLIKSSVGDAWITSCVLLGDRSGGSSRGVNVDGRGRLYARGAAPLPLHLQFIVFDREAWCTARLRSVLETERMPLPREWHRPP